MSFTWPFVLVALAALPALLVAYLRREREREQSAAAFASPALADSFAPDRPGRRRHLPPAAFALALAALIVAAARPTHLVAVAVERATIMLATDVSGSMAAADVRPTRLAAADRAAAAFASSVPARISIGVMEFNQAPTILAQPTQDRVAVRDALSRMRVSGTTATGEAILAATAILRPAADRSRSPAPAAIVLLSDGASERGIDPVVAARRAAAMHVTVDTVSLGTTAGTIVSTRPPRRVLSVPPDPAALAAIAQASGGRSYAVGDATRLREVYRRLGSSLSHTRRRRELTASFAGTALVLAVVAAAMSLRWFGRLA